jgi:hypothetical protein
MNTTCNGSGEVSKIYSEWCDYGGGTILSLPQPSILMASFHALPLPTKASTL